MEDRTTRSRVMQAVKGRNNKSTERRLRAMLVKAGVGGFELNAEDLRGRPDLAFRKEKVAVFVNGCFWHQCPMHFAMPRTNRAYWGRKINENVRRDDRVKRWLNRRGWSVLNIWEHQLRTKEDRAAVLEKVTDALERRRNQQ